MDFKTKSVARDKEGYYVITKGSIQEEGIAIINIYAPKIGAPKHIKQILRDIKGEINSNTIIAGDSTPHLRQWIDCPDRKLLNKHRP